jgi:hypothetical protein
MKESIYIFISNNQLGLVSWILPFNQFTKFAICGVFNLIWSTIFCECWKRRTAELQYNWGVFDSDVFEKPRVLFHGKADIDPITNLQTTEYSK